MAKLHHATLKSAVGRYKHLVDEGQTEQTIIGEIRKDQKAFSDEEVNEIYAALTENKAEGTYIVVKPFRDIEDFTREHKVGDNVSHFDKARIEKLEKNGHVEKQ